MERYGIIRQVTQKEPFERVEKWIYDVIINHMKIIEYLNGYQVTFHFYPHRIKKAVEHSNTNLDYPEFYIPGLWSYESGIDRFMELQGFIEKETKQEGPGYAITYEIRHEVLKHFHLA